MGKRFDGTRRDGAGTGSFLSVPQGLLVKLPVRLSRCLGWRENNDQLPSIGPLGARPPLWLSGVRLSQVCKWHAWGTLVGLKIIASVSRAGAPKARTR